MSEYDAADTGAVQEGMRILNACRSTDSPWMPQLTPYRREMQVRHSWDGTPVRHFLARVDGVGVGLAELEVGEWDNRDFAWFSLYIHPDFRRRGLASDLLKVLEEGGRERACTKIGGAGWESPAAVAFAHRHGFERAAAEIGRVQYPLELPEGLADAAVAEAAPYAQEYAMVRIVGHTPEDLLSSVVRLTEAINDAPTDELEVEDEVFTVARVQGYERHTTESGHRLYRLVARHRASRELAGHTIVAVDTETPSQAHQHDTSVRREHRGHRLGLLLKAEMMRWLAESEPQIESLDTWNAESNTRMIGVNERLGYRVVGRALDFQRRL